MILHRRGIPIRISQYDAVISDQGNPVSGSLFELPAECVKGLPAFPNVQEGLKGSGAAEEILLETVHEVGAESIVGIERGDADGEQHHRKIQEEES
jgi:hypothetical protein